MIGYAVKTWRRIGVPALWFWTAAVFLFGSALLSMREIQQEKSQPCRLMVTSSNTLNLDSIAQIDGVQSCTAVYELSVILEVNGDSAVLTLYGVDSRFVEGTLTEGTLYPESSAMPYLVLNQAAVKALTGAAEEDETTAWTGVAVTLNGTAVAAICGIIEDSGETPMVYLSQTSAKALLVQLGLESGNTAWLELQNAGYSESVAEALIALGASAQAMDSTQAENWDAEQAVNHWRMAAGIIGTLAGVFLLSGRMQLDAVLHREEYTDRQSRGAINLLRVLVTAAFSGVLGLVVLWVVGLYAN
ncbi:MAG: hypothetical protein LUD79_01470 [Oscillospiraceae bacterium]|nr:hypothetical protein [Oscillospiraceae bacterium]